jgi:hypothetical protein
MSGTFSQARERTESKHSLTKTHARWLAPRAAAVIFLRKLTLAGPRP